MKKLWAGLILLVETLALSSCAHNTYNQKRYQSYVNTVPPIVVPEGLTVVKKEPYYAVPKIPASGSTQVSLVPPGSKLAQQQSKK